MEIIAGTTEFYLEKETAVAIGKFDGIHIGHRRLLEEILVRKREGMAACVFTFDPPPGVMFGLSDGKVLTTREEKRVLLERMGVDILVEFPLDRQTASIPPAAFVKDILAGRLKAGLVAAGSDVSFGAGGAGNAALLAALAPECGFALKTIDKVCFGDKQVSSTYVRSQVEQGNMLLTEQLMGMPYTLMGRVKHGRKLGRKLGMPTVNLLPGPEKLLPPKGVYFSTVLYAGSRYRAISNIGYKPTVSEEQIMGVESYLYDFRQEIYGEEIEVRLHEFKRPEMKFDGVEALKAQLMEDIRTGAVWSRNG